MDRICLPNHKVIDGAFKPYASSIADSLIQYKLLDFIADVQTVKISFY